MSENAEMTATGTEVAADAVATPSETPVNAAPAMTAEPTAQASSENSEVSSENAEMTATGTEETAVETPDSGFDAAGNQDGGEYGDDESDESKRVVRMLSVGQPVKGMVKRVSDFGAFVDIGVGRDGLVHISELSVKRIGKVSDLLKVGQEVTLWIKKLDRERNRISLTMIEPGTKTMRDLEKGDIVQGTVTRLMPYGAFVDLGVGRDALLHVREMGERFVARPEDVVTVGEVIETRIIEISRRRSRIDLSMKGLRPEPEPEPTPTPEPQVANEPAAQEPVNEDQFADVEVLSPIELAFKLAMEASGKTINMKQDKPTKRNTNSRSRARAMQEEIISRTLGSK
ncbi:MAG: S1 RNA-binding domain-containing protein [Chloroflexi bacterium]|nr:S1 RNA-binding domain-containing protein [Chloroflexota bacterium]